MKVLRVLLYCLIGGLCLAAMTPASSGFLWRWLAGILFTAAFVPVAVLGPRRPAAQFGVVFAALALVTVLCLWSEAFFFMPAAASQASPVRDLLGGGAIYAIFAAALAALAYVLKLTHADGPEAKLYPIPKVALRIAVCAVIYMVAYLVFGGITYQFFTRQYYPDAPAMVQKLGLWFWAIQFARGVLMTLGVLPAIRTLRMSRLETAVAAGLMLWLIGGAAPLVAPNPLMVPTQRLIHTVEILTQNFTLGFAAAILLRAKSQPLAILD
jgi:hypothetical protein